MGKDTEDMYQGKFITFEGTEGVGKTTQIQLLEKYLKTKNIKCLVTREPGGTILGERIRKLLLNNDALDIDPMAELLLMFSARAQHLKDVIYPALKDNIWVLCDRFTDASYAYQGGGRGLPYASIRRIETVVQDGFTADLTILLSGDIESGMRRVSKRGDKDRFELEKIEFFERVRHSYLNLAKANPERFSIVDADQTIDKAALAIQTAMKRRFAELIA
ncbi:MAG: dTMP kinase [Gammaproteobacteria bacterium]|nr:dTMP kinase [Gammaproteobacteria bacterium]